MLWNYNMIFQKFLSDYDAALKNAKKHAKKYMLNK